MVIIVKCKKQ